MGNSQSRPHAPQDGAQMARSEPQVSQASIQPPSSHATQEDRSSGMEFKSVLDFFGGSFSSDHFIGDLAEIHQCLLSLATHAVDSSATPEKSAWVKLLWSIFHSLTGNLKMAYDHIDELSRMEGLQPKWTLRITVYQAFYESLRRFPPAIRFQPELGGPTAAFRNIELGFVEMINTFQKTLSTYFKTDLPLFRFEAQILHFLILPSLFLWNNAFLQHPSYAKGPWEIMKAKGRKAVVERMKSSKIFRNTLAEREMVQLGNYLARLDVELEYGQSPVPPLWVKELKSGYDSAGARHDLATMKMLEADYIISPPFSNPIALNLIIYEGNNPEYTVGPWDNLEGDLELGDTRAAGKLYCEALELFPLGSSPRGRAAIFLRQGCIEHMQACIGKISVEEKKQACERAEAKFSESLRLFGLDETHCQIVRGHQILLNITSGKDRDLVQEAAEIGYWGFTAKNELISRFIGNLMLRFGRRQMLGHTRNDVALKCFRCARTCFAALADSFGVLRAITFEMNLLASVKDSLALSSLLDKQRGILREVVAYIDKMTKEHPLEKSTFNALKMDIILICDGIISSAYRNTRDVDALEGWKAEVKRLRRHENGESGLDEVYTDQNMDKYLFESEASSKARRGGLPLAEYRRQGRQHMEDFENKNGLWRDHLRNLDIEAAEDVLRKYIDETAPGNAVSRPEAYGPVFAACQLGDFALARRIFNTVPNREFSADRLSNLTIIDSMRSFTTEKRLEYSIGLDKVLTLCALSQDWVYGYHVVRHIEKVYPKSFDESSQDISSTLWSRLSSVGVIYENSNEPLKAFNAWLLAVQLAEQNRTLTSDAIARAGIFNSWSFGDMFTGLARLCFRTNKINLPITVLNDFPHHHLNAKSWHEHALLFLEQAKARNLLDSVTTQMSEETSPDERLTRAHRRRIRMALLAQPNLSPKEKQELASLEAELKDFSDELDPLLNTLRSTMSSVSPGDLYTAVGSDELVIAADFSSFGFTLFGITSAGIVFAEHRPKMYEEIRRPVIRALKHLYDYPNPNPKIQTSKDRKELDVFLQEISEQLILPVSHLIREKKHVIFVTSQPLSAFPFSILPLDGQPLFLHAAVSQAPSLTTLFHLSKLGSVSVPAANLEISVHAIAKAVTLVALDNGAVQEKPLQMAAIESMVIAHMFKSWPTEGSTVSRLQLKSLMTGKDASRSHNSLRQATGPRVFHISSHGSYNALNPWMSHLSLQDKVRVIDMMSPSPSRSQNTTRLIVFAACLSGMGSGTLGNDVLGFAHVVLGADCAAYLGALWKVDDRASMLLMCVFYRLLRERSGLSVAKLWQEAQKTLFGMDRNTGKELLGALIEELDAAEKEGYQPELFVKRWREQLGKLEKVLEKQSLDFTHPFYVGPFVVVGFGGMVLR